METDKSYRLSGDFGGDSSEGTDLQISTYDSNTCQMYASNGNLDLLNKHQCPVEETLLCLYLTMIRWATSSKVVLSQQAALEVVIQAIPSCNRSTCHL